MKSIARLTAAALLFLASSSGYAAPAGALDPTFGTAGKTTVAVPRYADDFNMVRDAAGRIYLITSVAIPDQNPNDLLHGQLLVTRLHHDGTLDQSYGVGGTVTLTSDISLDSPTAAAMQSDGKIVVGFRDSDVSTCRLRRDGSLDLTYGNGETPGCSSAGSGSILGMGIQADGRIVLVGFISLGDAGLVTRLKPDGTLDTGFGDNGSVRLTENSDSLFNDVGFAPNGDIIAAGKLSPGDANEDFLVIRLRHSDGQPDWNFGTWGLGIAAFEANNWSNGNHDRAQSVVVLPNGRIATAGYAGTPSGNRPAVAMFTSSGQPDESFGPGGKRIYENCMGYEGGSYCYSDARDVAVTSEGKIVIAGVLEPDVNAESFDTNFFAMRIRPDGVPDAAFGSNSAIEGMTVVPFDLGGFDTDAAEHVAIDGKRVLLVGKADMPTGESDPSYADGFALARLDHGLTSKFTVTPKPGAGGAVSPAAAQQIGHSDRAEFVVIPDPGFELHEIEKGPGYCDGGMDGDVFVSAPVQQSCEVHLSFRRHGVFNDGFE